MTAHSGVGRRLLAAVSCLALGVGGAAATSPASAAARPHAAADPVHIKGKTPPAGRYVVVLADQPETAYDGHIAGYPATRPARGGKFQNDASARHYRGYLESRQNAALSKVGGAAKIYSYTSALNGFTANLTGAQVVGLRKQPGVVSVVLDKLLKPQTTSSPRFLGLSGRHGVWAQHGGPAKAGRGIVIGDIDTGIWPENPSFAGSPRVPAVRGFSGVCQPGERWDRSTCNSKIISARYFVEGFGATNIARHEFLSPRDGAGHGSHTASTAAGNHGVPVHIEGQYFGKASGMAPAAHLAVYKACWEAKNPDNTGCYTSDTVSAINKAVQDGVDVINFSISGSQDNFADPVERAFLGAAVGGVFVATSAGNSGPTSATVAHPSPWEASVAASTHHLFQGSVVLGNGKSYVGAMISDQRVSMRRIILSTDAAKSTAKHMPALLCRRGTLDPAKTANRIVVCERGIIDRVAKSAAVKQAGGAGMVLVNPTLNSLDADFHAVPTVHLDDVDGPKVEQYVKRQGRHARAALNPNGHDNTPIPQIAPFSSRGPSLAANGDVLKPDISAPGVSVIAAVAPPTNFGRRWDVYSGTSMASPHIAGLAAFIKNLRPKWSPAIIKSAMMTTARNLKGYHSPFAQGAGNVNPRRFLDPGLAYDAGFPAWQNLITGETRPTQVNQASIAIGDLAGTERVVRRVTNVSDKIETYRAKVTGVKGVSVAVHPATIRVAPGRIRKFEVHFTATDAARFKKYATGHLTWKGSRGHVVRSPLVVRPVAVAAPGEVSVAPGTTTTTSGYRRISGKAGFTGQLDLAVVGLEGVTPQAASVDEGGNDLRQVDIPAGTAVVRFDVNAQNDSDDLDLYLLDSGGNVLAASATGEADEQLTVKRPPAGTYYTYVDGYDDASGSGAIPYTYTGWVVPKGDQGNLTVSPDPVAVTIGERFHYRASWQNLDASKRWFGYVNYVGRHERTYITIN